MLHNSLKLYEIVSSALLPFIFFGLALKIAERKGFVYDLLRKVIRILPLEDHFPAETSGTRSHIYKHVRRTDDLLVVLCHSALEYCSGALYPAYSSACRLLPTVLSSGRAKPSRMARLRKST